MTIDFSLLEKILKENNSFLITTHVNPDADAIGSEIAMYEILKTLGKKVRIVNYSATPYYLMFLDPEMLIEKFEESKHSEALNESDVIIVVDLNNPKRLVKMEKNLLASKSIKICLDHHQNAEDFVDYMFSDVSYSATCHVIADFIEKTRITEITHEIAVPVYAGIMTDLGSFRFEKTTAEVHRLIAKLLDAGANPVEIYNEIYDQNNYSKLKLLGESLSNIQFNKNYEIAFMVIHRDTIQRFGADESEVDGFVNYCLSIKGVKIGLLFFELHDGVKISFRSKNNIKVNLLAEEFGGGGHQSAAGTRLFNTKLDDIINKVISAAEEYLTTSN